MTMPPKTTTIPGGGEPQLTPSEMAAITRFHSEGYDGKGWSREEKAELSSALRKAYGATSPLRPTDFATLRKWAEKVGLKKPT